jgi:polyhydroxybutyrate depolymerase
VERTALAFGGIAAALAGCVEEIGEDCATATIAAGETVTCRMPGWVDRAFDVRVPDAWDGASPLPVIVAIHGGGAYKVAADTVSCPDGDQSRAECLGNQAIARGYAMVMPNGTGMRPLRGVRTWNVGGGVDGYVCGFGAACALDVDDVGYLGEVLDIVDAGLGIDPARVFATGISNGGAMSHRLACQASDRFAAIVAIGGSNLHADTGGACAVTIPVLDIHGTDDPVWPYDGGEIGAGLVPSVDETMEGWRTRNGCAATFVDEALPDLDPGDGTTSTRRRYDNCAAATERIEIAGGGHTWPSGNQYANTGTIGRVPRDFGSEIVLDFFDAHPRP